MHRLAMMVGTGLLSLAGFMGAASAADLSARTYTKAPPMAAPVYSWAGCYAGVEGGGEWGRSRSTGNGLNNGVPTSIPSGTLKNQTNLSGGMIGGTVGCNYQMDHWVFGIEGDASWTSRSGSSNNIPPFSPVFREDFGGSWLGTVRGRVGYTVGAGGSVLLYGTAGGAFTDVRIHEFNPTTAATSLLGATERETFAGWTAGAGVEWGFAPGWSAKLEYLYVDFGRQNYFQTTATGCCTYDSTHLTDNLVRVGVNYHFNWAGPVVAKF